MGDVLSQWSVAWICSFLNFLLFGVARLSGLLYLAAIGRYNVDRSRASLPFVLCYTVRSVAGPLIGYLGRRVEIRVLIASGCFLSALGAGACFFAEDITTVSVLWGGVFGVGFGLGTVLVPEVLNQHFDKYISNANGIALVGESIAGFVLPAFVEYVLYAYGASGTFLILSGIILNGVPAALLLKPPSKVMQGCKVSHRGQYLAVTYDPHKSCMSEYISITRTVKNIHEENACNLSNCQRDYMKVQTDNSEVFQQSESYQFTDGQSQHGTSSNEFYKTANTATGSFIVSESFQPPTSPITTDHCSCNKLCHTNTSILNLRKKYLTSCSDSMNQKPISLEIHSDQIRTHCSDCSAIVSSCTQSIEEYSNNLQSIVDPTADHNHSHTHVMSRAHFLMNSSSIPGTESSNQSTESSGHNLLEESPDHNYSYSSVIPHSDSITDCHSVPHTEYSNQYIESSGHNLLQEYPDHNHRYSSVAPHSQSITNCPSVPRTQFSNQSTESSGHNFQQESPEHNHRYSIVAQHSNSMINCSSVPRTESSNKSTEPPRHTSPFCVFLDPAFLLILFTQSSMIFIFTTIMTIIVDFSRDAGVLAHQEVYILMCLSIADMLGRFGLGWVTDAEYMSNVSFSALCYAGTGLMMVFLVLFNGFTIVMVIAFIIGLLFGGLLIVCPGIIMDYIQKEEVTMALASRTLLYAPMGLTQSLLIGFFRENLGSYHGLFYVLAAHCFICCAFSLLVPIASRCRDSRNEPKYLQ